MKKVFVVVIVIVFILLSGFTGWLIGKSEDEEVMLITKNLPKPKPLAVYSIEYLSETEIDPGILEIKDILKEEDDFTSYLFEFEFKPNPAKKETKTTTGLINIPSSGENLPLILMLRGYVDQEIYTTGMGTRSAAEFFTNNGFITIAPDFLGYAESDEEAENIFESRFQTYTSFLSLLKSLSTIEQWNHETIFLWAHSNGGQIALTVLEISGEDYPTSLWAPVSKPFPYSILYYTDESEDRGKLIRRELAKFEDDYDTDKYSITQYLDNIEAPLQIHQGTADDAVPKDWSDDLVKILKNLEKEIEYFIHVDADHNLRPAWDEAVQQDLEFFEGFLN